MVDGAPALKVPSVVTNVATGLAAISILTDPPPSLARVRAPTSSAVLV